MLLNALVNLTNALVKKTSSLQTKNHAFLNVLPQATINPQFMGVSRV